MENLLETLFLIAIKIQPVLITQLLQCSHV